MVLQHIPIWVYVGECSDSDNSFVQFKHDIKRHDNILRYFICNHSESKEVKNLTFFERLFIIKFKSKLNRAIFIASKGVVTSSFDERRYIPNRKDLRFNSDITNLNVCFMPNNILFSDYDDMFSKERNILCNKIMASTKSEEDLCINRLHFRKNDILLAPRPVFQKFTEKKQNSKKILIAFSSRKNLIEREKYDNTYADYFTSTDYFVNIYNLLTSFQLHNTLRKNGIELVFKLPKELTRFDALFKLDQIFFDHDSNVQPNEYICLITDYTSFIFDFLFCDIPVIHYVPDKICIKAGLHFFRNVYFEIEKYCDKTNDINDVIDLTNKYISNNKSNSCYDFFFKKDQNISDTIYKMLKNYFIGK